MECVNEIADHTAHIIECWSLVTDDDDDDDDYDYYHVTMTDTHKSYFSTPLNYI